MIINDYYFILISHFKDFRRKQELASASNFINTNVKFGMESHQIEYLTVDSDYPFSGLYNYKFFN
jgi:hypothetical protein